MKILKKIIIVMFVLLFCLIGCNHDVPLRDWVVEIKNNLSYPIYAIIIFIPDDRYELGPIAPGEVDSKRELLNYPATPLEAHRKIKKISIFSENEKPFMILQGEEMDEYVIFIGEIGWSNYTFRLEVEEEYEGIGLD